LKLGGRTTCDSLEEESEETDWKYHFVEKQWLDQLPSAGSTANGWINCQWLDQLSAAGSTANGWINCQWLDQLSMAGSSLVPRPPPFFVLWFAFSIIHGSRRARKTGKAWFHLSRA